MSLVLTDTPLFIETDLEKFFYKFVKRWNNWSPVNSKYIEG